MKTLLILALGTIIGYTISFVADSLEEKPRTWQQGFNEGVNYSIQEFVDKKILLVPIEPDNSNFYDCIFVNVVKNEGMFQQGSNNTLFNSIFFSDPPSYRSWAPTESFIKLDNFILSEQTKTQ